MATPPGLITNTTYVPPDEPNASDIDWTSMMLPGGAPFKSSGIKPDEYAGIPDAYNPDKNPYMERMSRADLFKKYPHLEALSEERARIDQQRNQLDQTKAREQAAYEESLRNATAAAEQAQARYDEILVASQNSPYFARSSDIGTLKAEADAAKAALAKFNPDQDRAAFEQRWSEKYQTLDPLEAAYSEAEGHIGSLAGNASARRHNEKTYQTALKEYDEAVTKYDKDRAAFKLYQAQKGQYDMDVAKRQADIDAGRYAVNPYLFLAQGANINEIEDLRKQVNEGKLRPNMRVPTAPTAPTEVKDPGAFMRKKPVLKQVEDPHMSDAAARILKYKPPKEPGPPPELRQVSTEAVDVSSVKPTYTSPETTPDRPTQAEKTPKAPAPPAPVPPTTNTLQQTSTTAAQAQPTQQTTTTAPTTPPPAALPEQESGAVSGQQSSTGQPAPAVTEPKPDEEPQPFKADVDEEENNPWEQET